jgi:nucleotide-binding universal stress UspA family protein
LYKRVIVPLDGSDLAEQALPNATQLARASEAPLHLVSVVGYPYLESKGLSSWALQQEALNQVVNEENERAEQYLESVRSKLAADGFEVSSDVRRGVVDRAILADPQPGDVIVMTTHGRGGVARWFLGSVAEDVVRRSTVPVLLVRIQPGEPAATSS